jgi:Domain of unknown function (DUF4286)
MIHSRVFEDEANAPVVYEITVRVEPEIRADFSTFMIDEHVPDLLATGHFSSATIGRDDDTLRISYVARSRTELQKYLDQHASWLRAAVIERFPQGFQIERREWQLVADLEASSTC